MSRRSAGPIAMYCDDFDRADLCKRLGKTITKRGWTLHSFVLMATHYHLLVEVDQDTLEPGMHMLNSQLRPGLQPPLGTQRTSERRALRREAD